MIKRGIIKNNFNPYEEPENPHLRVCGDEEEKLMRLILAGVCFAIFLIPSLTSAFRKNRIKNPKVSSAKLPRVY